MSNYTDNINQFLNSGKTPDESLLSPDFKNHPTPEDLIYLSAFYETTIDAMLKNKPLAILTSLAQQIKLIVLDVDGVMTDGGMYYTESGDEFKKFNTKDGMGIKERAKQGVHFGIISSGINNGLVERRAELLGINHVFVGKKAKLPILETWCKEMSIGYENVAYIGDDINDIEVMREVGFTACPSDAMDVIKNSVDVILEKKGGEGCIREWLDRYFPM